METVKFANGSVYDCPAIYPSGDTAFVILSGVTIPEAAQIATDEGMTSEFDWCGWRYIGYTQFQAVSARPEGSQIILAGGHFEQI